MEGVSGGHGTVVRESSAEATGRGRGLVVENREITFLSNFEMCH